jgi:HAD superfamily hydrolase (TIGR01549 family)
LQAVLFDLEGTLVESAYQRSHKLVTRFRSETKSHLINSGIPESVLNGYERIHSLRNVAFHWAEKNLTPVNVKRIRDSLEAFSLEFDMISARESRLYPDTIKCLESLCEKKVEMAVVTNTSSSAAEFVLMRFELDNFFSAVVTRSDVSRIKPDPAMIKMVEEKLYTKAGWLIGDSSFDAEAANRSEIISLIIRRDGVRPDFHHDHFIKSLDEIFSILGLALS